MLYYTGTGVLRGTEQMSNRLILLKKTIIKHSGAFEDRNTITWCMYVPKFPLGGATRHQKSAKNTTTTLFSCPLRGLLRWFIDDLPFYYHPLDAIEACGSCDAVPGSTSRVVMPSLPQTRLNIVVSDKLIGSQFCQTWTSCKDQISRERA